MSSGSVYKEGSTLTPLTTSVDRAYQRGNGEALDTDNNATDFSVVTPSQPQNSASSCSTVGPTNPSGIGSATPGTVHTGDSTLLTVAVTGGTNPASTGLAVTGDLSSIGGAASAAFFDDGSHGDATAGDGTFSLSTTVDSATSPGSKSIPTTIATTRAATARRRSR